MVREHLNLDWRPTRSAAQIAVSERIDNSFANRRHGIFFYIFPIQSLHHGSTLHIAPEDIKRGAEHIGNGAFDTHVVQELLLAWYESETQRGKESLKIFSKSQYAA